MVWPHNLHISKRLDRIDLVDIDCVPNADYEFCLVLCQGSQQDSLGEACTTDYAVSAGLP